MPIASGAAGRVDVGVGRPTGTTWTADGLKRKPMLNNWGYDSYLKRYLDRKQIKRNNMNVLQGDTDPCNQENDGAKEESLPRNGGSEGPASEKPPGGGKSKKSRLCVIL